MKRTAVVVAALVLAAALLGGAGCTPSPTSPGTTAPTATASGNSDQSALAAARAQMQSVAPDAMPVLVSSAGGAVNPPPTQWQITFASSANGRMYSVLVSQGRADKPRDLGRLKLSTYALANVIPYEQLKVGADQAYTLAKAQLSATGTVPPQVAETIVLVEIPSMPGFKPAVWQVTFLNGASSARMRQANVDAETGAVTVTK